MVPFYRPCLPPKKMLSHFFYSWKRPSESLNSAQTFHIFVMGWKMWWAWKRVWWCFFWELFIFHPLRTLLNLIENYSWADFLLLDTLFWWWKSVDGWTMVSVHLVLLEKWSGLQKYGSWSSMLSDFSAFSTSNLFSWASILCFSSLLPFLPATLMWKSWKNSLCS